MPKCVFTYMGGLHETRWPLGGERVRCSSEEHVAFSIETCNCRIRIVYSALDFQVGIFSSFWGFSMTQDSCQLGYKVDFSSGVWWDFFEDYFVKRPQDFFLWERQGFLRGNPWDYCCGGTVLCLLYFPAICCLGDFLSKVELGEEVGLWGWRLLC